MTTRETPFAELTDGLYLINETPSDSFSPSYLERLENDVWVGTGNVRAKNWYSETNRYIRLDPNDVLAGSQLNLPCPHCGETLQCAITLTYREGLTTIETHSTAHRCKTPEPSAQDSDAVSIMTWGGPLQRWYRVRIAPNQYRWTREGEAGLLSWDELLQRGTVRSVVV